MTDANQIARGIIEKYDGNTFSNAAQATAWLENRIAAALIEYGEDEVMKWRENHKEKWATWAIDKAIKADTVGYRRAEKISEEIVGIIWTTESVERIKILIASQLDEAVREAWGKDDLDHFERVQKQGFREGYAAAREQAADAMAEAVKKCADGLHAGFLNVKEVAESLDLALVGYQKLRNPLGINIVVDPTLQPGEWYLRK